MNLSFTLQFYNLICGFTQQKFSINDIGGDLSRAHPDNPEINSSVIARTNEFEPSAQKCLACHRKPSERIPDSGHAEQRIMLFPGKELYPI